MLIALDQFDGPPAIIETMDQSGSVSGVPEPQASPMPPVYRDPGDPWEGANRQLYGASEVLDRIAVRPLAMTYRRVLPRPVRNGVHNALSNLDEPRLVVDHLLQGRVQHAGGAAMRFATNSTVGILGIFDVAKHAGWNRHDTDFGVTLGRLNVGAGPYVYVPILGPSSVRDIVGTGVDFALDPLNWIPFRGSTVATNTATGLRGLDTRAAIERDLVDMKRGAVDPYATIRSIYTQLRASEIRGGVIDIQALPDFPDEATPPVEAEPPATTPAPSPPQ